MALYICYFYIIVPPTQKLATELFYLREKKILVMPHKN